MPLGLQRGQLLPAMQPRIAELLVQHGDYGRTSWRCGLGPRGWSARSLTCGSRNGGRQCRGRPSCAVMRAVRLHEPEAPPLKLCPTGALIPLPHGHENNSLDCHDQEISRHDNFRALRQALRPSKRYSMARRVGPTSMSVALTQRLRTHLCAKRHTRKRPTLRQRVHPDRLSERAP